MSALVAIFGGLGYLEGRAQSTHAFRGPVEIAREGYSSAHQWRRTKMELPLIRPTAACTGDREASGNARSQQRRRGTTGATSSTQPETAQQNSTPATTSQPKRPAAGQAAATQPAISKAGSRATLTTPPSRWKLRRPRHQPKPQPGQQELDKALNASDAAAAAAWLWKATSRGNPEAPVRLADMYIKGNGVPKSCEQAMVLLRSAAIKENAPARNRLAALYANGTCVARDPVKAYQLMSSALAADPSSDWAKENREQLWNQMTPQQRAEAQKSR